MRVMLPFESKTFLCGAMSLLTPPEPGDGTICSLEKIVKGYFAVALC